MKTSSLTSCRRMMLDEGERVPAFCQLYVRQADELAVGFRKGPTPPALGKLISLPDNFL